ncbi:hypothetical protein CAEBREN_19488 [Caenorhabditis brenneri]|uniref:Uncharacterized protein n=1 Tax=Caenorhabditis brenneri TaxID=135651 RepID=G0NJ56_CAEBE|nr:hypothetical protein CAEBREN_19488 [Caenorhabditis brenneri]
MSVIKTFKEQFNECLQEVNDLSEAATKLMGPVVNQSIGSNQLVELRSQLDECANDIDKMLDEINKVLGNEPENNTDSASRLEMDEFVKQVISERRVINELLKGIDLKLAKGDLSGTSENPSVREFRVDKPSVIKVNTNVSASTDSDSPGQVGTTKLKSPTNSSESTPIEVQDQLSRRVQELELRSDKRDSQMTKIVELDRNAKDAMGPSMEKLQTFTTLVDEHSRSRGKNTGGASSTNQPTIKNTQAECSRVLTENPQMLIAARQVVKEFDGTVSEYPLFINTFNHFIDKNPHFTQDVKLGVLMSLLKGRAAQEIQATAFTADEYDVVRSNMERQYNRNRLQEQLLLEKLFDFQFAEDNVAEVQSSLNEYCNLAYRLQRQGIDLDNRYFLFGFVDKLPPRMRAKVHKKFLKSDATFKDLSEKAYELLAMFEAEDRMNRKAEERKRRQMVINLHSSYYSVWLIMDFYQHAP